MWFFIAGIYLGGILGVAPFFTAVLRRAGERPLDIATSIALWPAVTVSFARKVKNWRRVSNRRPYAD